MLEQDIFDCIKIEQILSELKGQMYLPTKDQSELSPCELYEFQNIILADGKESPITEVIKQILFTYWTTQLDNIKMKKLLRQSAKHMLQLAPSNQYCVMELIKEIMKFSDLKIPLGEPHGK